MTDNDLANVIAEAVDFCYGCRSDEFPRSSGRTSDSLFIDTRTGRRFCAECVSALVSWELDGRPDDPDFPYLDWIDEESKDSEAANTAEGIDTTA